MKIVNPADDTSLGDVSEDDATSVRRRAAEARSAQRGWWDAGFEHRSATLRRFRALVQERASDMAATTTSETGKPITQSQREIQGFLGRIDYFLDHSARELADEIVLRDDQIEEKIAHEPLGVVANVSAWNYPYFVGGNVFVPALLTGNAVLYKPSELATLTGLGLGQALHDAGVPSDVFSVVVGGPAVGTALLDAPIDAVFFTGSHATGTRVASQVAPRLLRLQLELGGKDPAYVTDDVEVAATAASVADGAFYNAGQSCCAIERVYVHRGIWDEFVEHFVTEVRGFVVGDPTDERTYIGPLARRRPQVELLEAQVADSIARGARLLTGGRRIERPGHYFEPTVLRDASHEMRVMTEESFGPIIGLMRVHDDEEAARLMADTPYGLTAAVFGRDRGRAERILRSLRVGTAYWNCSDRVSPRLPWSGRGASGLGCTLSSYGIEAFLQPKAWHSRRP